MGLGGHRLAVKIPKSSSSRARVDVAAQILPLVKKKTTNWLRMWIENSSIVFQLIRKASEKSLRKYILG